MEIVPKDAGLFKSAIDGLKDFLPEAQLDFSNEGLGIRGMDASHVGYVDYFLSAADCSSWKVPKPCVLGVNMASFAKVLDSMGKGGSVSLSHKKEKFCVSYTSEFKTVVAEIHLLDITQESLDIPTMEYPAVIKTRTADIVSAFKEVGSFGDSIGLRFDDAGFHVSAKGDIGSMRQTLKSSPHNLITLSDDSVEAMYGTKYVLSILKSGAGLSSTTELGVDPASPLRATFSFGSSRLMFYLAPKTVDA
jgi:proliferating cell nuclear antigen PCNA